MELFLWKGAREINDEVRRPESLQRIVEELSDIVILCLSLANRLEIDVAAAIAGKLAANGAKYPSDLVRGKAHKIVMAGGHHRR